MYVGEGSHVDLCTLLPNQRYLSTSSGLSHIHVSTCSLNIYFHRGYDLLHTPVQVENCATYVLSVETCTSTNHHKHEREMT